MRRGGATPAGSPREVYFADFGNAAPDELVCDIAQPIEPVLLRNESRAVVTPPA